jgi:hypothetical protein
MKYLENIFSLQKKVAVIIGRIGVLGGEESKPLVGAEANTAFFYSSNEDVSLQTKNTIEGLGADAIIQGSFLAKQNKEFLTEKRQNAISNSAPMKYFEVIEELTTIFNN